MRIWSALARLSIASAALSWLFVVTSFMAATPPFGLTQVLWLWAAVVPLHFASMFAVVRYIPLRWWFVPLPEMSRPLSPRVRRVGSAALAGAVVSLVLGLTTAGWGPAAATLQRLLAAGAAFLYSYSALTLLGARAWAAQRQQSRHHLP